MRSNSELELALQKAETALQKAEIQRDSYEKSSKENLHLFTKAIGMSLIISDYNKNLFDKFEKHLDPTVFETHFKEERLFFEMKNIFFDNYETGTILNAITALKSASKIMISYKSDFPPIVHISIWQTLQQYSDFLPEALKPFSDAAIALFNSGTTEHLITMPKIDPEVWASLSPNHPMFDEYIAYIQLEKQAKADKKNRKKS